MKKLQPPETGRLTGLPLVPIRGGDCLPHARDIAEQYLFATRGRRLFCLQQFMVTRPETSASFVFSDKCSVIVTPAVKGGLQRKRCFIQLFRFLPLTLPFGKQRQMGISAGVKRVELKRFRKAFFRFFPAALPISDRPKSVPKAGIVGRQVLAQRKRAPRPVK